MKKVWQADDGFIFENEKECRDYENESKNKEPLTDKEFEKIFKVTKILFKFHVKRAKYWIDMEDVGMIQCEIDDLNDFLKATKNYIEKHHDKEKYMNDVTNVDTLPRDNILDVIDLHYPQLKKYYK